LCLFTGNAVTYIFL